MYELNRSVIEWVMERSSVGGVMCRWQLLCTIVSWSKGKKVAAGMCIVYKDLLVSLLSSGGIQALAAEKLVTDDPLSRANDLL